MCCGNSSSVKVPVEGSGQEHALILHHFQVPVLVGEADSPAALRLASVLLLRRLLPLGDDVTDLRRTRVWFKEQTLAVCRTQWCSTFTSPWRQCSRCCPVGSSVYRLNPDSPVFLVPASWFRPHWNSSTVVAASKLTTLKSFGAQIKNSDI